jgi:hypothetical protein
MRRSRSDAHERKNIQRTSTRAAGSRYTVNVMHFIDVVVEDSEHCEGGLSMRFKCADDSPARVIKWIEYESEAGLQGRWDVFSADEPYGPAWPGAKAYKVEDSSDGTVWLIKGGPHGLALMHDGKGTVERVPYLLLSLATKLG